MFKASSKPKTVVPSTSSNDFEPYCEWKRHDTFDKLIVHVPDFKKEHLRVQVNNMGVLKITGDRPTDSKKSQFHKECRLPENCDVNQVQAKLSHEKLTITMPKKPKSSHEPAEPKTNDIPSLEERLDNATTVAKGISLPEKMMGGMPEGVISGGGVGDDDDTVGFGRFRVGKKVAVRIGIVLGVAAVSALVVYKCTRSAGAVDSSNSSASSSRLITSKVEEWNSRFAE